MDAEAEFGLAGGNTVLAAESGKGAGGQGNAERDQVVGGLPGHGRDRLQVRSLLGIVAGDLFHEHHAGDAARLGTIRQGDVVLHDHDLDFPAERAGAFHREAEVQPVAGIVLEDDEAAALAGHRHDRCEHGVDRWRGEDLAADRGGQHALADEGGVRRFVTRTAARDDGHAAGPVVGAEYDLDSGITVEARQVGAAAAAQEAVDRVHDKAVLRVDELHGSSSLGGLAAMMSARSLPSNRAGACKTSLPGAKSAVYRGARI